ncbi:hypothetical protein B566_EDAN015139 [Ephemera danica]|nr:hypothetical protein B566_EDAN015139 [Ephemera danica]
MTSYEHMRKPKYKNFTTKEDRLKSFKYWPKAIQQTPEDLASNGFHYTGCGDRVICFDCGLGLKDWHEEDTPHEEHRRYSPNCNFLKWTAECQETSNKKSNTASLQCRKCLVRNIDTVNIPCGHMLLCNDCVRTEINCKKCGKVVFGYVVVFLQ